MSDQTPGLSNLGSVDGKNLINLPGGAGINSINGDASAAQILSVGAGLGLLEVPPVHNIFGIPFAAPATPGIVAAPAAATPTDYLGADNLFHALPGSVRILGAGLALDLQAIATYNLYTVPLGITGAVVTGVVLVLMSGNPSISGDGTYTLTSPGSAGVDFYSGASTGIFTTLGLQQVALNPQRNETAPRPLYLPADIFQLVSGGGTDPCSFNVYVLGFEIP